MEGIALIFKYQTSFCVYVELYLFYCISNFFVNKLSYALLALLN